MGNVIDEVLLQQHVFADPSQKPVVGSDQLIDFIVGVGGGDGLGNIGFADAIDALDDFRDRFVYYPGKVAAQQVNRQQPNRQYRKHNDQQPDDLRRKRIAGRLHEDHEIPLVVRVINPVIEVVVRHKLDLSVGPGFPEVLRFDVWVIQVHAEGHHVVRVVDGHLAVADEVVVFFLDLGMPRFGKLVFLQVIDGRDQCRIFQPVEVGQLRAVVIGDEDHHKGNDRNNAERQAGNQGKAVPQRHTGQSLMR